ncbi:MULTISPECIES: hypothetical protein [unclassified Kitasatospora]
MTDDRSVRTVDHDDLVLVRRLGQGGQGTVHEVADRADGHAVAYKEYRPETLPGLDADALAAMVALLAELDPAEARWLLDRAAWPTALVRQRGRTCGFLMGAAPERFHFDLQALGGATAPTRRPATLEFLLNDDDYVARVGLTVSDRDRLRLLADLATTLSRLHGLGIAVGDLSPKNLLFATGADGGRPACFLIDCDAVRLRGATVLPQVETPDWQLPHGEERGTAAGDAHKLALLAVRLFARDQSAVDPAALTALSPALGELARAGLDPDPARRPAPALWAEHLTAAAATASTTPAAPSVPSISSAPSAPSVPSISSAPSAPSAAVRTVRAPGASPGAPPPTRTPYAAGIGVAAVVAAVILATVLAVAHNRSGSATADSGPTYTPAPAYTPTYTPTRTYTPTYRPSTPVFDPASLDDARTDRTPLTPAGLLPEAFTDSDGVRYRKTSRSPQSCVTSGMSDNVQTVLRNGGCVNQVVGTYNDPEDSMMVIIMVEPMMDARTAEAAYNTLSNAYAGDWGFWCPSTGSGSELCDKNVRKALRNGWTGRKHRYLVHTVALFINLSSDSSLDPRASEAAHAAYKAAGPVNYWG